MTLPACLLLLLPAAAPVPPVTFEQHVRPILKAHCLECHGENAKPRGGLDLRLRRLASKVIVPGDPEESPLFTRVRDHEMPPGKVKLSAAEASTIRMWIARGAKTARPEPEKVTAGVLLTDDERNHWSFQPVRRPAVPPGEHPIDAFLLAALRRDNLALAPEADRRTLIRRLTFDLIGLPPTPEEVEAFVNDKRPDAYERLVDRLLASPHHGERWGRHWLDVVGYADSHGGTADPVRPDAWRYRDWVVRALNADRSLDHFVIDQLAGDELVRRPYADLSPATRDLLTATGFLRTAPDGTASPGANVAAEANQAVADTVQIAATAFLGLTIQCAQCHNHRFDPVSQADYYRLRAIFEPALDVSRWRAPAARRVSLLTSADRAKGERIEQEAKKIDAGRLAKQAEYIERTLVKQLQKVPEDQRKAVEAAQRLAPAKRSTAQVDLLRKFPFVNVSPGSLYLYDRKAADELKKLADEAAKVRATKPTEEFLDALTEVPGALPTTRLFIRGDIGQPGEPVTPGQPAVLSQPPIAARDASRDTSGRRLAFANQLLDPKHPLLTRVLVNRLWMHHMGRGLVATPGDFGLNGERATHPELLDWLASELQHGRSFKQMHRLIVTSRAYRQAWRDDEHARRVDPLNKLLWRAPLRRLEAEAIRDAMLAVSGKLNAAVGGPPVPVMPDETGKIVLGFDRRDAAGYLTKAGSVTRDQFYRRGLYVQARRSMVHHGLEAFDAAQPTPCIERRNVSTNAQQSLFLMNSDLVAERARDFAARVTAEAGPSPEARVRRAYVLALGRLPDPEALAEAVGQLAEKDGLNRLCQALLSSNPFIYVD
jgi:mono/diheme cytochrome c family protein